MKILLQILTRDKNTLEFLEIPWDDSVLEYQTANQRERIFTPSYDQVIKPRYKIN